ncbi:MAG: oxygen-independent coproporphyrinogen III oxidase [Chitinophagaceae bacterium]|jgi:oxygen-independent coproporphyrinogen-3 oxidase
MKNDLLPLLTKYDVPVPRYTSYPTVPYWDKDSFTLEQWKQNVTNTFVNDQGEMCIYIHLPFCEELCTFCACNKRITKNHAVEEPYLEALLKEWNMYLALFPFQPVIKEIHFGGGTPTFFSPENLTKLVSGLLKDCFVAKNHEFSVEVHPNYTSTEHIRTLRSLGFNRISLGVQDFNPDVQYIINRIQTFEQTKKVIDEARELGFESVNVDLIYGLPKQTLESIEHTIKRIKELLPDRIAFYSYAHVPWKSKAQRRYTDEDVPKAELKIAMYELGNAMLSEIGFKSIGMDHFALLNDKLFKVYECGTLHRNFMGYTTNNSKLLVGLGASSIGDCWSAFAQNEKEVETYQDMIMRGEWAITGGHILDNNDLTIRQYILDLMCRGKATIDQQHLGEKRFNEVFSNWKKFEEDGLISINGNEIQVLENGKLFIRNISAVIDSHLAKRMGEKKEFSKSI